MALTFRSATSWLSLTFCTLGASAVGCGDSDDNRDDGDDSNPSLGGGANVDPGDGDGDGVDGGDGDGDGDSSAPAFCQSDKDCRDADGVCDLERQVCVDCLANLDCSEGELCRRGECTVFTPCDSSKDCADDEVCSEELQYCVNCEGDNDCAPGEACLWFSCLKSCDSDKDCAEDGLVCNLDEGICLDCVVSADCDDDQFCNNVGLCQEKVCSSDDDFCDGDELVSCDEDGRGFSTIACEGGCDEASCDEGECTTGDEGCECYGNDTCNGTLSCLSDLCVDASGGTCPDLITVTATGPHACMAGVIDNFDDDNSDSCFGGSSSWYAISAGVSFLGGEMNISGDVAMNSYGGAGLRPDANGESVDLSEFTGIEFSASGTGTAQLLFGMHSTNSFEMQGHISETVGLNAQATTYRVPFCQLTAISTDPEAPVDPDLTQVTDVQILLTGGSFDVVVDDIRYY